MRKKSDNEIRWGDIYFADLGDIKNHHPGELSGKRPVVILQNNVGNRFSPTVTIVPVTSCTERKLHRKNFPTHVFIKGGESGMVMDSIVESEQIQTISKKKLLYRLGSLKTETMEKIIHCLVIQTDGSM